MSSPPATTTTTTLNRNVGRKRRHHIPITAAAAAKNMEVAVSALQTIAGRNRNSDEVDCFCKLLAIRIKKFDEQRQESIMEEIEEVIRRQKRNSETRRTNLVAQQSNTGYVFPEQLNAEENYFPSTSSQIQPTIPQAAGVFPHDILRHAMDLTELGTTEVNND